MKVKVTQQNINLGQRFDARYCPIALALSDRGYKDIRVGLRTVNINGVFYMLDAAGQDFVKAFDSNNTVQPIELELTKR